MVEMVGMHGFDESQIIRDLGKVRQAVGEFRPGLAMSGKGEAGAKDSGIRLNEGIALALDYGGRNRFSFDLRKLWLVVKEFELAVRTCSKVSE